MNTPDKTPPLTLADVQGKLSFFCGMNQQTDAICNVSIAMQHRALIPHVEII